MSWREATGPCTRFWVDLQYQGPEGTLGIEALDAPVVSLGRRHPWYYTTDQPDLAKGFHFSLFNNAWGTNYVHVVWRGHAIPVPRACRLKNGPGRTAGVTAHPV